MGELKKMPPRGLLTAKDYLQDFMDRFGDNLECMAIVGIAKDGDIIDGWSSECGEKIATCLGMIEQLKLDFWDSKFCKRSDMENGN